MLPNKADVTYLMKLSLKEEDGCWQQISDLLVWDCEKCFKRKWRNYRETDLVSEVKAIKSLRRLYSIEIWTAIENS